MEGWLWAVIGILVLTTAALLIKIHVLQKTAGEISEAFAMRLAADTNTLIDISTRDRHMRRLANTINKELRNLRVKRCRYEQGDTELKAAVTNISHDLRTPLTAICGYLDLLETEERTERGRRYIEVIKNRVEFMKQLTEELFRYSVIYGKEGSLVLERVAVDCVLEESIAAYYSALLKRGITPIIRMPEEHVTRKADKAALSRVFSNLLNNAIKYSDGDLEITLSETGEIWFVNTASGLNEVQVGKLFDRFYTVETAESSTGLGLSIAKTLVRQMNGTITSGYENGRLTICIVLPDVK